MTDRLKQIVEKYTLKETDGFEGKKDKETNVEEDLRKNYETGKMVPYQSVIAEGKIVTKPKLEEAKVSSIKLSPKLISLIEKSVSVYVDNFLEYTEDTGYKILNKEKFSKIVAEDILINFCEQQLEDPFEQDTSSELETFFSDEIDEYERKRLVKKEEGDED